MQSLTYFYGIAHTKKRRKEVNRTVNFKSKKNTVQSYSKKQQIKTLQLRENKIVKTK